MSILDNYPGSKGGDGVYQTIINHIPPHDIYYELFAGSAQIYRRKQPAQFNTLNDINPEVAMSLAHLTASHPATWVDNKDWREFLYQNFDRLPYTSRFFYLDPPYPLSTRKTNRKLYAFEMSDQDHRELLMRLVDMDFQQRNYYAPCYFMISTYPNKIYENYLKDWYKIKFNAQTRGGIAQEVIYMNYSIHELGLHEYTYLGKDFRKREQIKHRQDTIIRKLRKMQPDSLEFKAALQRIQTEFNLKIQQRA